MTFETPTRGYLENKKTASRTRGIDKKTGFKIVVFPFVRITLCGEGKKVKWKKKKGKENQYK